LTTKILGDPAQFRDQWMAGYLAAYPTRLRRVDGAAGIAAADRAPVGRVGIVTGGGTGHYPLFAGLVGQGMVDVCAVGDVFASPASEDVYRCTLEAENSAGVLHLICNYGGDVMNFALAAEQAREDGLEVETAVISDDVASAPADAREQRRGIAGGMFVYKAAGAAAARGDALAAVKEAADTANAATRSFGIAFSGCTLPGADGPFTEVAPGTMEVGLGIHGEPGMSTSPIVPADEIAELLLERVLGDAPAGGGNRVAVLLNGLGATPGEELFLLYGELAPRLAAAGLEVHHAVVGEVVTSFEMAGCSLSLHWLDERLQELYDAPASTPGYSRAP
jgi:dihydroxyacetone kinase